ncbi:MAG: hypothetical protein Q4E13_04180 [Clostridia bacterium]|nr:hypothetical protein [Clostridia bacterium]
MRALREMVGLPVLKDGACIGHVLCGQTDPELKRLTGIWVSAGWMGARRIDRRHVNRIGDVAVLVTDRGRRGKTPTQPFFYRAVSTDGSRLGAIVDAEVDGNDLSLRALWLTRGYPDDLLRGRQRITKYAVRATDGTVLVLEGEEGKSDE